MAKGQLIDEIRELNPSAPATFLAQFEESELQEYLEHLRDALDHRIHISGWVRPKPNLPMAG